MFGIIAKFDKIIMFEGVNPMVYREWAQVILSFKVNKVWQKIISSKNEFEFSKTIRL